MIKYGNHVVEVVEFGCNDKVKIQVLGRDDIEPFWVFGSLLLLK